MLTDRPHTCDIKFANASLETKVEWLTGNYSSAQDTSAYNPIFIVLAVVFDILGYTRNASGDVL